MAEIGFEGERISRYFKGGYTDNDASYVDEVFCDSNKEKELKNFLSRQFYELLSEDEDDRKNLDHILYRIHYRINTKLAEKEKRKLVRFLDWSVRIAGMIILSLSILWGVKGYLNSSSGKETWVEIKAPAWTRAQFSLPDGTTGWLNSNSSIRYNGNFSADRQVSLTGEAFFDVVKDNKRPFLVNANEVSVKVLGTRFNIASYENEKNVEVVLEEGNLIFSDKKMNKSCSINPNELVIYDKTLKEFSVETVETQKYLSWTEGKLVFRNDPLNVVARRLERWYNVDVDLEGFKSDDIRLRATFVDENLEEVLYFLKRSLQIDYNIKNGEKTADETYTKKKVIITVKPKKL